MIHGPTACSIMAFIATIGTACVVRIHVIGMGIGILGIIVTGPARSAGGIAPNRGGVITTHEITVAIQIATRLSPTGIGARGIGGVKHQVHRAIHPKTTNMMVDSRTTVVMAFHTGKGRSP